MKFETHLSQFGCHIIFLHGLMKTGTSWNVSEFGLNLGIEEFFRKISSTTLVSFELSDYNSKSTEISNQIYSYLIETDQKMKRLIIVGHSVGGLYAMKLAELYPKLVNGLILIDIPIKSSIYLDYLKTKFNQETDLIIKNITQSQLNNFDDLPDGQSLYQNYKLTISVHLNILTGHSLDQMNDQLTYFKSEFDKFEYFRKLTNKNIKSEIKIYPNGSHMIHYSYPKSIIKAIQLIL